jgi:hypothetical protein
VFQRLKALGGSHGSIILHIGAKSAAFMQTLNLGKMKLPDLGETKLPASRFPEPADTYLCDNCGRNITKHLHPARAHVATPIGPSWYICRCGTKYVSGAVEWVHLGQWERRRRIEEIIAFGLVTGILIALFGLLINYAIDHHNMVLMGVCIPAAFPVALIVWLFVGVVLIPLFEIAASVIRTRTGLRE